MARLYQGLSRPFYDGSAFSIQCRRSSLALSFASSRSRRWPAGVAVTVLSPVLPRQSAVTDAAHWVTVYNKAKNKEREMYPYRRTEKSIAEVNDMGANERF